MEYEDGRPNQNLKECPICKRPLSRLNNTGQCFHHNPSTIRILTKGGRVRLTPIRSVDPDVEKLLQAITNHLPEATKDAMLGPSRRKIVARGRYIFIHLLRYELLKCEREAVSITGRVREEVSRICRDAKNKSAKDPSFAHDIEVIREAFLK